MAPVLQRFDNRGFSHGTAQKIRVSDCEIMILYPTDSRTPLGRPPNEEYVRFSDGRLARVGRDT